MREPCSAEGSPRIESTSGSGIVVLTRNLPYGVNCRATGPSTQRFIWSSSSCTVTSYGLAARRVNR